eukprot:scaffold623497_cov25-Prasinocladus_malaysianus.AAC.2
MKDKTSLYKQCILREKEEGAMLQHGGSAVLAHAHSEQAHRATRLLKFLSGHLYSGKLALIYGHAPPQMPAHVWEAKLRPPPIYRQ